MTRRRSLALQAGFIIPLLAVIYWYSEAYQSFAVAPVPDVLAAFQDAWLFDRVTSDVVPTLERLFLGYALAVLIAVPLGICLGSSRLLRMLAGPLFAFFRSVPPIALIPPALIVFGLGNTMKLFLIVVVCVWPIVLNASDGVVELDRTMLDTTRSYRLSRWERLRYAVIPAVAPRIFAGMHTSLAFAIIVVVASEYLAGTDGIGFFIFQAQSQYSIAEMWAGILLLGMLGFLLNLAFVAIQRRVLFWQAPGETRARKASEAAAA
ncbi:MAG: ABC transporter permease [Solirubrobacteraceae bacterium]|nr:ABC transporter permease [Solirubrobacteraceae bacterium]